MTEQDWTFDMKNEEAEDPNEVLTLLATRQRSEATELLVEMIKKHSFIYTIRDDIGDEVWIYRDGIYIPQGKTYIKQFCRAILGGAYTTTLSNDVISKIAADTYIDGKKFFEVKYPHIIAVSNGLLNLFTRELRPFSPEEKHFNKIPVAYEPGIDCPEIDKHLHDVMVGKKDIDTFYEHTGHCLYKDWLVERGLVYSGKKRNGKGKTIGLQMAFLGPDNCTSISLKALSEDDFAAGHLLNKLANNAGDIGSEMLKDTSVLKGLTGRDSITHNRKFLPRITFVNYAKFTISANQLPVVRDGEAFFTRWGVNEFPYTFYSQSEIDSLPEAERAMCKVADPDILSKITTDAELSGLLNMALDGLARLRKNKEFSNYVNCKKVQEFWTRNADSFRAFCMDHVVVCYGSRVVKSELKSLYRDYYTLHKVKPCGDKHIRNVLTTDYGAWDSHGDIEEKRIYYWEGIKIKGQGGHEGQGFQTYIRDGNSDMGVKTISSLSTLSAKTDVTDVTIHQKLRVDILAFLKKNGETSKTILIHKFCKARTANGVLDTYTLDEVLENLKKNGEIFEPHVGRFALP